MDEWTVRTPAVLFVLAMALSILYCLAGWLGNEQALATALATLTTFGFLDKGRMIEIEALYISLFGMALVIWLGFRWRGWDTLAWMASGLVLGLGFLAKGPLHVWYFYALVVGILAAENRLRDLLNWRHFAGLTVFFATFLPWAVLNHERNPLKDSAQVWQQQITQRLGFAEFDLGNYLLQIPESLKGFLPWAVFLPLCWRSEITGFWRNSGRHGQWMLGLRKGLPWAFLVIAILPSSRPRFLLPLNVAAAILVTDAIWHMGTGWLSTWGSRWRWITVSVSLLGLSVVICGPLLSGHASFAPLATPLVLVVGAAIVWWQWHLPLRPASLAYATSGAIAVLAGAAMLVVVPHLVKRDKLRPFAAKITTQMGPTDSILLYKVEERLWPFYLGLRCHEVADLAEMPKAVAFQWAIVPTKICSVPSKRRALTDRVGTADSPIPLQDPIDHTPFVLVHLNHR